MFVSTAAFASSAAADKIAWCFKFTGPKDSGAAARLLADPGDRLSKLRPAGGALCDIKTCQVSGWGPRGPAGLVQSRR